MSILRLPEEIFVAILDFLPVASIQHLSATCQKLYERIHQNDPYWSRKLRHEYKLNLNRTFMGNFAFDGLIEVSKCLQYTKYYVNRVAGRSENLGGCIDRNIFGGFLLVSKTFPGFPALGVHC